MNPDPVGIFRDVPGVDGAFLLTNQGQILARDTPAFLPPPLIEQLGGRLGAFFAAAAEGLPGTEEALIRCALQSLYLRRAGSGFLGVLCRDAAQIAAVRFAANIFVRQVLAQPAPQPAANRAAVAGTPPPKRQSTRTGIWG